MENQWKEGLRNNITFEQAQELRTLFPQSFWFEKIVVRSFELEIENNQMRNDIAKLTTMLDETQLGASRADSNTPDSPNASNNPNDPNGSNTDARTPAKKSQTELLKEQLEHKNKQILQMRLDLEKCKEFHKGHELLYQRQWLKSVAKDTQITVLQNNLKVMENELTNERNKKPDEKENWLQVNNTSFTDLMNSLICGGTTSENVNNELEYVKSQLEKSTKNEESLRNQVKQLMDKVDELQNSNADVRDGSPSSPIAKQCKTD